MKNLNSTKKTAISTMNYGDEFVHNKLQVAIRCINKYFKPSTPIDETLFDNDALFQDAKEKIGFVDFNYEGIETCEVWPIDLREWEWKQSRSYALYQAERFNWNSKACSNVNGHWNLTYMMHNDDGVLNITASKNSHINKVDKHAVVIDLRKYNSRLMRYIQNLLSTPEPMYLVQTLRS